MVNSKRRLDSDSEEEQKEVLVASSSQLNAGSAAKVRASCCEGTLRVYIDAPVSRLQRARLATNSNGHTSPASELTRIRPEDSDEEEEHVDELATPAPQAASSRKAANRNGNTDVSMREDDSDDEEGEDRDGDGESESDGDEDDVRDKAMSGRNSQKGVSGRCVTPVASFGVSILMPCLLFILLQKVAEAGVVDTVV